MIFPSSFLVLAFVFHKQVRVFSWIFRYFWNICFCFSFLLANHCFSPSKDLFMPPPKLFNFLKSTDQNIFPTGSVTLCQVIVFFLLCHPTFSAFLNVLIYHCCLIRLCLLYLSYLNSFNLNSNPNRFSFKDPS